MSFVSYGIGSDYPLLSILFWAAGCLWWDADDSSLTIPLIKIFMASSVLVVFLLPVTFLAPFLLPDLAGAFSLGVDFSSFDLTIMKGVDSGTSTKVLETASFFLNALDFLVLFLDPLWVGLVDCDLWPRVGSNCSSPSGNSYGEKRLDRVDSEA